MKIWGVMDDCIRTGVSTSETVLPGRLGLRRRAPMLYRRLMRGSVCTLKHHSKTLTDVYTQVLSRNSNAESSSSWSWAEARRYS